MTHMYGIAITYGVVSLLLLSGIEYLTFKMVFKNDWKFTKTNCNSNGSATFR